MKNERILIVIDAFSFGGAQKVLLELIPQWVSFGHQVEVVLLQDHLTEFSLEELQLLGVSVRRVHALGILDARAFMRFISFCYSYKPTHIQAHLYWSQLWSGIYKIFSFSSCLLWVEHNTYFNRTRLQWATYRILASVCTRIVSVSFEVQDFLISKRIDKTHVILNPISPLFVRDPSRKRKLQFVLLGRLNQQKNPWLAIDSFEWAMTQNLIPKESELIIAGDGPLLEQLRAYVADKSCSKSVRFLGFIQESEVVQLLQESTALISSSIHEGFPLVRVEALAMGLGIVTTLTGGVKQYLTKPGSSEEYVSGVFVVDPNISAFAIAIAEVIKPEYWTADSIESRVTVSKRNDSFNIARGYLVNFSSKDLND